MFSKIRDISKKHFVLFQVEQVPVKIEYINYNVGNEASFLTNSNYSNYIFVTIDNTFAKGSHFNTINVMHVLSFPDCESFSNKFVSI